MNGLVWEIMTKEKSPLKHIAYYLSPVFCSLQMGNKSGHSTSSPQIHLIAKYDKLKEIKAHYLTGKNVKRFALLLEAAGRSS